MGQYIHIESNDPESDGVTLVDEDTDTGYRVRSDGWKAPILGSPQHAPIFSTVTDSINGTRLVGETEDAREYQLPIGFTGSDSNALAGRIRALFQEARKCSEYGGTVRWRPKNLANALNFIITKADLANLWSHEAEARGRRHDGTLAIVAPAYAESDPHYYRETFDRNVFGTEGRYNNGGADWTQQVGSSTPDVTDGDAALIPTTTGANIWTLTGPGIEHEQLQVTTEWTVGTLANTREFQSMLKYIDANNYAAAHVTVSAAGTLTTGIKVVADGVTVLSTTGTTTAVTAGSRIWIIGGYDGQRLSCNVFVASSGIYRALPRTAATAVKYEVIDQAASSANVITRSRTAPGFGWNTAGAAGAILHSVTVEGPTFRAIQWPQEYDFGDVGGDTDALMSMDVTSFPGGSSQPPIACVASTWRRPARHNLCWNSGAENDATGWAATGAGGAVAAGGVVTRVTTQARPGGVGSFQIADAGGTANRGMAFPIYRRLPVGTTVNVLCWMKAASGTQTVQVGFGFDGGSATFQTARALSTNWEPHFFSFTTTSTNYKYYEVLIRKPSTTAQTWFVDDVLVWESPATAKAVADVYADDADDNPVAYFRLDEASGNVASSVGAYTGTVAGNPTYGKNGPIPDGTPPTTCMDFDGTGDYVEVPYDAALNPSPAFSLEAWVQRDTDTGAAETILDCISSNRGFRLQVSAADVPTVTVGTGATTTTATGTGTVSVAPRWHHVVATYDGTSLRVYLNGALEVVTAATYSANTSAALRIGALLAGTSTFNGKIANVRIYDYTLDPRTIVKRYIGTPPTLVIDGGDVPLGVISGAQASTLGSGFTRTVDLTNYRNGYGLRGSGALGANGTAEWYIHPWAVTPDAYTDKEITIDVYARFELQNTQTSVVAAIDVLPEDTSYGATRRAFGVPSSGKSIPVGNAAGTHYRPHYIGSITLPVNRSNPKRMKLKLTVTNGGGAAGTIGLDYLVLVPTHRTATTQTNVPDDSSYGDFMPNVTTHEMTKRISWDLKGWLAKPNGPSPEFSEHYGLRGSPLLLPPENGIGFLWLPQYVIDRTDANSSDMDEPYTDATVTFNPTARYAIAREDT